MRVVLLGMLSLLLLLAVWKVASAPAGYALQDRNAIAEGSVRGHLAGTDELGRDRAQRIAFALLLGLGGSCLASFLASAFCVVAATGAALGPNWAARVLLFTGDLGLTLPWLFLLMLVRSVLPLSLPPMQSGAMTFALLGVLGVPAFLRIHYGHTASLVQAEWMVHAHASGFSAPHRMRSMLPHLKPLVLTQFLLYVPACLAAEANLGALGLGLSEPLPSMGNFIANLQSAVLLGSSWLVYLPIGVLVFVLLALELSVFGEQR